MSRFTEGTIYTRDAVIRMARDPLSREGKTTIIQRIPWWIQDHTTLYPDQERCAVRDRSTTPECAPEDVRPCILCARPCCRWCSYADVVLGDLRFAAACDMNFAGMIVSGSQAAAAEYGMAGRYCIQCATPYRLTPYRDIHLQTPNPWEGLRKILMGGSPRD